jgi:hypothetical protein
MKRVIVAAVLCAATQVFAGEPATTPAPKTNAADVAKQAKEQKLTGPETDAADAADEKEKMPAKDKQPKVKQTKQVEI